MLTRILYFLSVIGYTILFAGNASSSDFVMESLDNDFPAEIQAAQQDGKKLVIMFSQHGCPFCEKMLERVIPDELVNRFFSRHFIMIESNVKGNLEVSFDEIFAQRKSFYKESDLEISIKDESPKEVAQKIIRLLLEKVTDSDDPDVQQTIGE